MDAVATRAVEDAPVVEDNPFQIKQGKPDTMKRLYITLTAVCVMAMSAEAQQRPGGGRPGGGQGGQGGPGGGFRGQGGPGGGRFGGGGQGGGFGDFFRGLQGGAGGEDWRRRIEEMRRNPGSMRDQMQNMMIESGRQRGLTFNEAPTMRMSMFDVVERIGGARAEGILAKQLEVTARGAEIVHLDGNLERIAGDKYVEDILAAVKAVLANPPELDTGMRVDERGTDALWGLLRKYEDDSFVDFAKEMLVDEDGRLHRQANDYLRRFFRDGIMQLYSEAYANPDLDDDARSTIRREARNRMGQDPAANAIVTARFTEYMNTLANPPAEPAEGEEGGRDRRRRDPVSSARDSARGYLEALARDRNPESIAGRKALLGSLRATTNDAEVSAMMDKVDEHLTALADPEKSKNLRGLSLGGDDRRGFGQQRGSQRGGQGPGGGQRPGGGKN